MALTADEKEAIMQARGEASHAPTGPTRVYRPVVSGKAITMLAMSELSHSEAEAQCRAIFGERFSHIEQAWQAASSASDPETQLDMLATVN